jgi:hypothetical protein
MRGVDEIFWIHGLAPQNHALSPEVTDEIARSLMNPSFEVSGGNDPSEPYAFVRLFGLSFAKPTLEMNAEIVSFLIQLLFDQHEFISAGAVQVIMLWVLTYEMEVPSSVIYQTTAAIVDERRSPVLRDLYRALFRLLGSQSEAVASILSSEPSLGYDEAMNAAISEANWAFPHFAGVLTRLPAVRIVDYSDSMTVLGSILNSLGMTE